LEPEKGAAEAKARAMETAAYGAIIVLIVLVVTVACAFALSKRRMAGVEHQPVKSETRELEPDALAEVTETKSALNRASQRSIASRSRQGAQLFPSPTRSSRNRRGNDRRRVMRRSYWCAFILENSQPI
jgi:hypothetical protein